jgi:serine/threonine protein kinase
MKFCPVCKRNWEDDFRVCPIDGLPLQAIAGETDPYKGKIIGQARITDKIADGEMGPVYRAEDPARGMLAVQFISSDKLQSPVLAEAFEDAVKLAAKVNHPNVIRTYSLEHTQDGQAAVLMEHVAGSNLDDYRRNNPMLDVQQACRIVKETAEGILAAHRLSMMHGSLVPSRILIATDGKVKIGGFHRSGLRDDVSSLSSASTGLIYMAPERAGIIQDMAMPDYRADLYSLGIILYELLAGKLPYEVKSAAELGVAMEAKPPLPPSMSNPQVSPTLSRVVLKAISKHPGDRQRSVEEFINEMEAARQPMRQPEMEAPAYHPPPRRSTAEDMDLFAPPAATSRKPPAEDLWPEAAEAKPAGEGTFFSWFKTQAGGKARGRESKPIRATEESSLFSRSASSPSADDFEGRTVLAQGRRSQSGRRSFTDTFTSFGGKSYSRDQDLTSVDTLPRRRFFSKAYILMAVGAVVLIAGILAWFLVFRGPATGKVKVESEPSGARVSLDNEYIGTTPLYTDKKAGTFRLRLELEGYESTTADLDISPNSDVQRFFSLKPQESLATSNYQPAEPPLQPPVSPPVGGTAPPAQNPKYDALLSKAIASRNFYPPASGNAWEILQSWQMSEGATPTPAWERARQNFCRELETLGGEKLDQRDYPFVRGLLEQTRNRIPNQACVEGLQARFNSTISRSIDELRSSLSAAMNRQNYVTPESDNALKYVRLILGLEPQDVESKTLERDIYSRALDQARAKSKARLHQEALDIYTQLKNNYPNPPGGLDVINQGIEQERNKLNMMTALKAVYIVQVKHDHGLLPGSCTGNLRADGFNIEYQSDGKHSFKIPYDRLKSISFSKGKILIKSGDIDGGQIELEQAEKNPSPSLAEVYAKIEEYRKLREQYSRP